VTPITTRRAHVVIALGAALLLSSGGRRDDLAAFLDKLPAATPPALTPNAAAMFVTMASTCLNHEETPPSGRGYLWEATYRPPDDYQHTLAFYGCYDWHSAVNSTWTSLKLLKSYPELSAGNANLIRLVLGQHLGASNLAGELAYLKTAGPFERPYGYAWVLKVAAELSNWKDPDAEKWSATALMRGVVGLYANLARASHHIEPAADAA